MTTLIKIRTPIVRQKRKVPVTTLVVLSTLLVSNVIFLTYGLSVNKTSASVESTTENSLSRSAELELLNPRSSLYGLVE